MLGTLSSIESVPVNDDEPRGQRPGGSFVRGGRAQRVW